MSRIMIMAPAALLALAGCQTAASIVTFPVKAAAQGVDWATTSQDESDRNYGREVRKREEAEGRAARKADKEEQKRLREERKQAERDGTPY